MAKLSLDELLVLTKGVEMTKEQREQQRRSFAYGNTNMSNGDITREDVDSAAEALYDSGYTP